MGKTLKKQISTHKHPTQHLFAGRNIQEEGKSQVGLARFEGTYCSMSGLLFVDCQMIIPDL